MDNLNLPASSPLDPSIFAHGKRRTALLTGLETPGDQPVASEVQDLIDHRQRTIVSQALGLQTMMLHQQAQQTPATPVQAASVTPTPAKPIAAAAPTRVKHKRRVPALQQMEAVECGAACLVPLLSKLVAKSHEQVFVYNTCFSQRGQEQ